MSIGLMKKMDIIIRMWMKIVSSSTVSKGENMVKMKTILMENTTTQTQPNKTHSLNKILREKEIMMIL